MRNPLPPPPIPQVGFYGRENAHRRSTDEWNFNEIFASAIGYLGERERGRRIPLSLSFSPFSSKTIHREGFDSIGRLYSQFLDEPWKIGGSVMGGVCSTQFSPDANHICLLFRGERRKGDRGFVDLENNETLFRLCMLSLSRRNCWKSRPVFQISTNLEIARLIPRLNQTNKPRIIRIDSFETRGF